MQIVTDLRPGVLSKAGIEDSVGDLVTDLVCKMNGG